ncbi:hypothetical protein O6072_26250 [Mycolicibacterium neoaurum]|uniref:hypothetical protein n=1 Tax=Mycolicibacterium neoaurum TaxID=1795 RepID=UPI00248BB3F6|nr:hypothetical protein [Mycolicibacterium neoaurum]WBS08256.1 hypothetical protein O6072_26250 [Mycolicibacterium neoaurum]
MGSDVAGSRESVQHALSDRAASVKALLDADFSVFDTAELLALQSERERRARADAVLTADQMRGPGLIGGEPPFHRGLGIEISCHVSLSV